MFYERKVVYLDYIVRQEKIGNAGFVKLEVREEVCKIFISVCNIQDVNLPAVKVYIAGDGLEKELCGLELIEGKGVKQLTDLDVHNISGTGISYKELEEIKILVSAEREICGIFERNERTAEIQASEEIEKTKNIETSETEEKEEHKLEENPKEEKILSEQPASKPVHDTEYRTIPLCEDKWMQLWEIYPHIMPFRDGREYLLLSPSDFVILPQKYFQMANNSFLLHGYYNYKHLVLKKAEYRGEEKYYIGVPGNFYDREKQVAIMFGFESFEGMEEPAHTGDYGYYLMRIEL